ncbi:hypothetical protein D3C79_718370 [compost metagenome]
MAPQPVTQLARVAGLDIQRLATGKQAVCLDGIGHRQVGTRQGRVAHLPTAQATHAQCQQQHRRRGPAALAALAQLPAQLPQVQLRRPGHFAKPGQCRTQAAGVGTPTLDLGRGLRVGRQPGLHLGPAHRLQALIDVSVQFVFAGDQARHFSLRKAGGWGLPSVSSRKALRARDRRDITVPIGIPRAWAASL